MSLIDQIETVQRTRPLRVLVWQINFGQKTKRPLGSPNSRLLIGLLKLLVEKLANSKREEHVAGEVDYFLLRVVSQE